MRAKDFVVVDEAMMKSAMQQHEEKDEQEIARDVQAEIKRIDKRLRSPIPGVDVLPEGAVLLFEWDLGDIRKREEAFPYALFMVGKNVKVRREKNPHYLGYWLYQEKDWFLNGKMNFAGACVN